METKISVLIAARDAAPTLALTLESVRRQSFAAWECLIADDGSADATRDLAADFCRRDPRFRLLPLPARGVVEARNAALAECRGEWIALLDADDLMRRRRLEKQAAALAADPRLDGVGCHVRYFPRAAAGEGRGEYERWLNGFHDPEGLALERFVEMPVGHPTLLLRAELLREHRYRQMGWPEDWDLLLRLLGAGARIGVVAERLHAWRLRPDSLSRRSPAYSTGSFMRCRAAFLAEQWLPGVQDYVLWGYGGTGKALRAALLEHGRIPSHIVEIHPGRIGNKIHGTPVIAPAGLRELRGLRVVVSVAGAQARRIIRGAMEDFGLGEGVDYVFAA